MTDHPPRSPSQEFKAAGLRSTDVDDLLVEIVKHSSAVMNERLQALPGEIEAILLAVFAERSRGGADTSPEEIEWVTTAVRSRIEVNLHAAERADLVGRTVRIRMSRPAMLFATRYYNAGISSTAGPGRHDTPTPLLPPAPVEPKR
jgi:hypothetical protein